MSINSRFTGLYEDGFYGDTGFRLEVIGFIDLPVLLIDSLDKYHKVNLIKPEPVSIPGGLLQSIPVPRLIGKTFQFNTVGVARTG